MIKLTKVKKIILSLSLLLIISLVMFIYFNQIQFKYLLTELHWHFIVKNKLRQQNPSSNHYSFSLFKSEYDEIILTVSDNVSNLDEIKKLKYLHSLNISSGNLIDLKFIENSNIISLILNERVVLHSLNGIQGKIFIELYLDDLKYIKDFTPLSTVRVKYLHIENSKNLKNLDFLKHNKELIYLDIKNSDVNSLTPAINFTNLEGINISGTQIKDLSPLEHLPKLYRIEIGYMNPNDLIIPDNIKNKIYIYNTKNYPVSIIKYDWHDTK